jgi:Fe-S-cluster containining protein
MADTFYADGLRFSCIRCSSCCRYSPGQVFLSKADIRRLLPFLNKDLASFVREYCVLVDTGMGRSLSLKEKAGFDCIFWEGEGCAIYAQRPSQCATYPFWAGLIGSSQAWEEEARHCPGIGKGAILSASSIEDSLYRRRSEGTILLGYGEDKENLDENSILGR